MNYQIPEGYEVEDVPKSIKLSTLENSFSFLYRIKINGNYINVTCKKTIKKTMFLPSDYQAIRNFYNQMISKQTEKIVLKKII